MLSLWVSFEESIDRGVVRVHFVEYGFAARGGAQFAGARQLLELQQRS